MKRTIIYMALFIAYIVLLSAVLSFQIGLLVDFKQMAFVMTGTIILTLLNIVSEIEPEQMRKKIRWNFIITGCLTTFLTQLSMIANIEGVENMTFSIIHNFLPLFYALLFMVGADVLFYSASKKKGEALKQIISNSEDQWDAYDFTKREKMIAKVLLTDLSNRELGDKFYISENTVKKHVQNIYKKALVKNRTEFIALFIGKFGGEKDE